jgi:hypothetical protein
MNQFKAFLMGKIGIGMLNAWLDIERYVGNVPFALTCEEQRRILRFVVSLFLIPKAIVN